MDNHNSKFSRFLSGKGFYVALAVCLVGTAAAAWVAIDSAQGSILEGSSVSSISRSSSSGTSASRSSAASSEAAVRKPASDVPVSSSSAVPPAPSSTAPAVSSEAPVQTSDQTESAPVQANQEDVTVVDTIFPTQEPLAFVMPADGEVFGVFSQGELVRNVTLGEWRTHDGVDIKAAKGTPVRAVADGVVSRVYNDPMWGTVVEITHAGGLTSITSGLDPAVAVSQGDSVRVEDTIGVVGSVLAEISMDSHIHFGLKEDGKWVDPIAAMGKTVE